MINFFRKLRLLFGYGPELSAILLKERQEASEEASQIEYDRTKDHLQLCYAHQQESKHSCYSKHNCDYCKLLAQKDISNG